MGKGERGREREREREGERGGGRGTGTGRGRGRGGREAKNGKTREEVRGGEWEKASRDILIRSISGDFGKMCSLFLMFKYIHQWLNRMSAYLASPANM